MHILSRRFVINMRFSASTLNPAPFRKRPFLIQKGVCYSTIKPSVYYGANSISKFRCRLLIYGDT